MRTEKEIKKDLTHLSLMIFDMAIATQINSTGCDMAIKEQAYPMPDPLVKLCKDHKTTPWDLISEFYHGSKTKKKRAKRG